MSLLAEYTHRQRRERRTQSRLASNQRASEAPGNHTVTMGLSEFSTPEAPSASIASTSGASHSTLSVSVFDMPIRELFAYTV